MPLPWSTGVHSCCPTIIWRVWRRRQLVVFIRGLTDQEKLCPRNLLRELQLRGPFWTWTWLGWWESGLSIERLLMRLFKKWLYLTGVRMESLGPAGGQMGCSSVSKILASFVHSSEVMGRQSLPRLVQKGRLPAHSLSLALTCSLWGSSCHVWAALCKTHKPRTAEVSSQRPAMRWGFLPKILRGTASWQSHTWTWMKLSQLSLQTRPQPKQTPWSQSCQTPQTGKPHQAALLSWPADREQTSPVWSC